MTTDDKPKPRTPHTDQTPRQPVSQAAEVLLSNDEAIQRTLKKYGQLLKRIAES